MTFMENPSLLLRPSRFEVKRWRSPAAESGSAADTVDSQGAVLDASVLYSPVK
jgi:hypothetical protein